MNGGALAGLFGLALGFAESIFLQDFVVQKN
jgi:hypothetical protein